VTEFVEGVMLIIIAAFFRHICPVQNQTTKWENSIPSFSAQHCIFAVSLVPNVAEIQRPHLAPFCIFALGTISMEANIRLIHLKIGAISTCSLIID
jgi:hypothetical protein